MTHKTFKNEVFPIEEINLELNSLTESDPYVDHVAIIPATGNVDQIKYSANKKVEESGEVTDPVSGVKFEASSPETRDQRLSEIPEILKKIQAKLDNGEEITVRTNLGRYSDENTTSFYITDDHIEDLEVNPEEEADETEDAEEETEEESESEEESEEEGKSEEEDGEDVIF